MESATKARPVPRARRWLAPTLLALGFCAFRWWIRHEPLGSDDMVLFQACRDALEGNHWLLAGAGAPDPTVLLWSRHQFLRIGLLPIAVPVMAILGVGPASYYAVPLLCGLVGFLLTWRIMDREIGSAPARLFALLHVGFLFEVREGTVFLVDLPAAVAMLGALVAFEGVGERVRRGLGGVVGGSALAALPLLLAYSLRVNALVLAVPGLLVLATARTGEGGASDRPRRVLALWTGGWTALGILLEQVLYVVKGLGFGFRWRAVEGALEGYSPYLPWYDVSDFPTRAFVTLWDLFGGGFHAAFVVTLYGAGLVATVAMAVRTRSPLLRAVAVTGLATWAVFSFAFTEVDGGRVHALAPFNFRYSQPFYYAAIVSLCWSWRAITRRRHPAAVQFLRVASVLIAALSFSVTVARSGPRVNDPDAPIRRALASLDSLEPAGGIGAPVTVYRLDSVFDPLPLFRNPRSHPPVAWRSVPPEALANALTHDGTVPVDADAVYLDRRRLQRTRRYLRGEESHRFARSLERIDAALATGYEARGSKRRYEVFTPKADAARVGRVARSGDGTRPSPSSSP